ncbi:hypothetical protein [Paraglaciecola polaris]|uniref:Uncharacterized protein n=1 Tax=Paraglaciecola polaris LMG 21857 TaxID=1129793 RepID=K6Z733_9ALTE|nr:hypothetical protein [Paraglaciecola polaris]GAC32006.1 hypothetical protein GPLA_1091 [Paraglaciecola polaris LMG 21857]|tara:strand:- start:3479 stop:3763 length:285 start_codon:yes stop_codon:yes gene_type:complete
MKNRKNLVLSSLFALVFSQQSFAQEFDLTSMYVSEQIEAGLQTMLADMSNANGTQGLNKIIAGLEDSLNGLQHAVVRTNDERGGNAPQTATLSE